MMKENILDYCRSHLEWTLECLSVLVRAESPTGEIEAVNRLGAIIKESFHDQGIEITELAQKNSGHHLFGSWRDREFSIEHKPAMLLGHFDTVWPIGQLLKMPLRKQGDNLYGPGSFDMKAGVALMILVAKALHDGVIRPCRPIHFLLMADEEASGPDSKRIIEEMGRECQYVLCLEPPITGNSAKTARKGSYDYLLETFGVAAHAGVNHSQGINAIEEIAHHILQLQKWTDYERGTTVNVGTVHANNASNVVPDYAVAEIDVRAVSLEELKILEQKMYALKPVHAKAKVKVTRLGGRPPLERSPAVVRLYLQAAAMAEELGFVLGEGSTGGSSDGSYTAAMGIPTLDGLGVDGDGGHALHEHIRISDIPGKAALLLCFLENALFDLDKA